MEFRGKAWSVRGAPVHRVPSRARSPVAAVGPGDSRAARGGRGMPRRSVRIPVRRCVCVLPVRRGSQPRRRHRQPGNRRSPHGLPGAACACSVHGRPEP
jgi:hypothetical protein